MKICYLADINTIHTQKIAKHFAQDHRVDVLSLNQPNSYVPKEALGFKTHFVGPFEGPPRFSAKFALNQLNILKRVRTLLKKLNPNILHAHFITDHGLYAALSGFHPLVVFAMGSDVLIQPSRNILYKMLYKYVLSRADVIHCQTAFAKEIMCRDGAHPDKVKVFPLGVDLTLFRPDPRDPKQLKSLGLRPEDKIVISTRFLEPIYSLDTLIRAIPDITIKFPEVRFLIKGNGSLENELKELSKKLNIQEYVRFVGFVPYCEIPGFINMADIYVSTSLSDDGAISNIEAMACSKPIVVADIPATREWVKDGWNGLLFPKQDHHALAERIKYLFANPELANNMGKRSRQITEARADVSRSMEEISSIYSSVTGIAL